MKLATFTHAGTTRVGAVVDDAVVDLTATGLPGDMLALLEAGSDALQAAHAALDGGTRIPLADVQLEAPIARPPKFLAVGLNYADHVAESGLETPVHPMIFNKQSTCVVGPGAPVHVPKASHVVDYEGELGFVVGQRCRHVSRDDAADVIAGYLVVDVARQVQPPQGHPEQEPEPGHGAVAVRDAHGALGKVHLEAAKVLGRGGIGRTSEESGKAPAAANVALSRAVSVVVSLGL